MSSPATLSRNSSTYLEDLVYETYKNVHPCWPMIVCAVPTGLVSLLGIPSNFCVIFVTLRTKTMKMTANLLLAMYSFVELLHQFGHLLFFFTALLGMNFINFGLAVQVITPPLFAIGAITPMMFFTGLDRFVCVCFPTLTIRKLPYLSAISLLCCVPCTFFLVLFYQTAAAHPDVMITGSIADLNRLALGNYLQYHMITFEVLTVIVYAITWILLRVRTARQHTNNSEQFNKHIFHSLCAIIGVNLGGYFMSTSFSLFAAPNLLSPLDVWLGKLIVSIPLNISASSNGPILYAMSDEYRKAFHHELALLLHKLGVKGTAANLKPKPPQSKHIVIEIGNGGCQVPCRRQSCVGPCPIG